MKTLRSNAKEDKHLSKLLQKDENLRVRVLDDDGLCSYLDDASGPIIKDKKFFLSDSQTNLNEPWIIYIIVENKKHTQSQKSDSSLSLLDHLLQKDHSLPPPHLSAQLSASNN